MTVGARSAISPAGASSTSAVTIEHEISPAPARIGPAVVTFRLADPSARAITGAHIAVEAEMSDAGMAPIFAKANSANVVGLASARNTASEQTTSLCGRPP